MMKENTVEGDDPLWTSNAASSRVCIQNKVILLRMIMLIYDEPPLSGQPPLRDHLPVSRVWPFNGGSTVFLVVFRILTTSLLTHSSYSSSLTQPLKRTEILA